MPATPAFLQRDQAPLSGAQWAAIDDVVTSTARGTLVARRLIPLVGPFGAGTEVVPHETIRTPSGAHVDLLGNDDEDAITSDVRRFLPLPLVYKDFWLHWRDLVSDEQHGLPLDAGKAAAAAAAVAQAEDRLILLGDDPLGIAGLLTVEGRQTLPMSDWGTEGTAFADVVNAVRALTDAGFSGPFGLLVSPRQYAALNRVFDRQGVLELEQVEKLARRGVYPTPILEDTQAIVVDSSAGNMDIAVGQDLITGYVESNNLNHRLRVMETLALRVRRPAAICALGQRERNAR